MLVHECFCTFVSVYDIKALVSLQVTKMHWIPWNSISDLYELLVGTRGGGRQQARTVATGEPAQEAAPLSGPAGFNEEDGASPDAHTPL